MEFWGHEVKPGVTVPCKAGDGFVIHLSQAALGETKKASENVIVFVKVGDKKLVIGTLSADKHPQISCDLIFDEDFELSHNSKTTSVFLCGYKSVMPDMFESDSGEDEDEEMETDEVPVKNIETEKTAAKVSVKDAKKDVENDSETSSGANELSDSDSEDDVMSEDDSSDDDDTSSGTDGSSADDSEDDSDSEDEETPVPQVGKKRAAATALKIPASDKKAKISTPKKETGDKKGVHVATPHPAKQASKTPADSKPKEKAPKTPSNGKPKDKGAKTPADSKAKEKSPKAGSHSCKSCSKTFNSAGALESHQKAKKHEA